MRAAAVRSRRDLAVKRRVTFAVLAVAFSVTGIVVPGALRASAKVPPVCVEHQLGPAHIEVGYCPNG
jgi:hypothetical protein